MQNTHSFSLALTHVIRGKPRFTVGQLRAIERRAASIVEGQTEPQRRSGLIEALYREYASLGPASLDRREFDALPPDAWLNERLDEMGERWRVQNVDGYRYEVYDAA